ncbi:hypothetical protein [Cellulomonas xylanilytica]|uniref:ABC-2 type transport system permease protein n=1 Tax=Cellulomonas xylanilytica TaxID=233583 RepID=A0A510V4I6_9CELL|nr:hypothetical protein [Cellulomonas xylanilytica]GEK21792.1 hypothetical protein CXY01_23120 [Cellulomonas xylanilytica]
MDRDLISLKFTMLRNTTPGLRKAGWIVGGVAVLATWAVAILASGDAVRSSALTLVFALWGAGAAVGPVMTSGAGVLRPDYFTLLPLPRAALGRGLLVSVFVSIASGFVLLALLATAVHALRVDPVTVVVVLVGAPLTWVLVVSLSRLVYGLLGAAMKTKLGVEIAGVQFGLMFAGWFAGWMIVQVAVQSVPRLLQDGLPEGPITTVVDALPTSWMVLSVDAAAAGDWARAGGLLLALAALDAVLVLATVPLLVPRSAAVTKRSERMRSRGLVAGGGILPATQTGAVAMKEVRQWRRDAWRALESSTAVWTGAAIGVFALLAGYESVASFAGLIVAFMLGLSACNLYGQDGSAVWQNVVGQDETSVRSDVHGRQWAMLIVFLPRALVVTVPFLLLSQAWWTVPVLLAAIPAVFGAAAGVAVLVSALGVSPGVDPRRRMGPNDANGNIALHVWIVLLVVPVAVLPTAAMVVWSQVTGEPALVVAAVVVGLVNGVGAAWVLARVAIGYLSTRMPDVFTRIRYGQVFHGSDRSDDGLLAWVESTTLKGEQDLAAQKRKQREARLARAAR